MINATKTALLVTALVSASPCIAADTVLQFDRGIGSALPFRVNNNSTPADLKDDYPEPNNFFAGIADAPIVNAGGQVWIIDDFKAKIQDDGSISAQGKGLLLGGGSNIGSRGGPRQVYASLFVRHLPVPPATVPTFSGPYNSDPVDLDANGDFNIQGVLRDGNGLTPSEWGDTEDNRPILLIRNVANNNWFAAGILKGN
ncbi:hypothetical protein [Methyloterricola oryzae]|uniref:hypothetical protein n=1 Tax=Methyloterricola oryzae TaxID=1495050 RepID=UPI0005EB9D3B|nr:hypothetical protein [Methyloterricola oryzae]